MREPVTVKQKTAAKYITPIDPVELAVRLAETYNRMKRPPDATAMQAFLSMEQDSRDAWLGCATTAMEYWRERIADLSATN